LHSEWLRWKAIVVGRISYNDSSLFYRSTYASAVHTMAVSVCLCVCQWQPQAGVLSKLLNVSSRKQRRLVAQDSSFRFRFQRCWWNFNGISINGGGKCTWGSNNLRLSTNNSLYLENGTIVHVKAEQEVECTVSNADDIQWHPWPQVNPIFLFWVYFISLQSLHTWYVGHSKSYSWDDKLVQITLKWACSWSSDPLLNLGPQYIFGRDKTMHFKFGVRKFRKLHRRRRKCPLGTVETKRAVSEFLCSVWLNP